MDIQKAKIRLMAECSRREISSGQARQKLIQWLSKDSPLTEKQEKEIGETISSLKKDKYIDDARFAKAFTRDKLRFSKWGPEKILRGLIDADVDKSIAEEAINEQEDLALQVLTDLLSKKRKDLERKKDKKNEEYFSKIESLAGQLKELDKQEYSSQNSKKKASIRCKIFALQTKHKIEVQSANAPLYRYARQKGFPYNLIKRVVQG